MTGTDWSAVERETFGYIADVLLGREFGARVHAVNGRGGDAGIDYRVDAEPSLIMDLEATLVESHSEKDKPGSPSRGVSVRSNPCLQEDADRALHIRPHCRVRPLPRLISKPPS